jgi:hypothetical protein
VKEVVFNLLNKNDYEGLDSSFIRGCDVLKIINCVNSSIFRENIKDKSKESIKNVIGVNKDIGEIICQHLYDDTDINKIISKLDNQNSLSWNEFKILIEKIEEKGGDSVVKCEIKDELIKDNLGNYRLKIKWVAFLNSKD